ncbi:MAG: hypothetical protein M1123_00030, partial [Candidatus Thermoplasmatota archaeon]|nr:hypothetical protein [Candidatus Thermoplasmatota archaeon]
MTQEPSNQPSNAKKPSALKWIAVIIVVIVIIGALVVVVEMHQKPSVTSKPLSIAPSTTAVATLADSNIIFNPGLPAGTTFTKLVWNFGNGHSTTVTSGN